MLREPTLCGGMQHVIDVYNQYAKQYFRLIVDELDSHGNGIEKVRAGYILEEHCKIHDPRIDTWHKFAQRGGSRKLDPTGEYSETFSERWSLSLNLPTTSSSGST